MIRYFQKWWVLLTYDGFKPHVNVTEGLNIFAEDRIKVGKEEAGTSTLNQAYNKFQAKQDKAKKRHPLELAWRKVYGHINHFQIIMIIYTAIQIFIKNYGKTALLLSTFILITACLFMVGSRILR